MTKLGRLGAPEPATPSERMTRRQLLVRGANVTLAGAAIALGVAGYARLTAPPPWDERRYGPPGRSQVAVLRASSYDADLEGSILEALRLLKVDVRNRRVLLKPNIVEFDPGSVINTDPRLVAATVAAMRIAGARSVVVGEGSGHRRDTEYIVGRSGFADLLSDVDAEFIDLNTAAVRPIRLDTSFTELRELWLPTAVLDADLVVSMPKMKTHHWGGVTLSLKNMFGTVPGRIYGWPKNVLHWMGLEKSILDVAAAVRPNLSIVDGIVGMQGNGPIDGDPVASGVIVVGSDPVAVDSTAARLMRVNPERVTYFAEAGRFLGQLRPELITQVGEDPERESTMYDLLDEFSHLRRGA